MKNTDQRCDCSHIILLATLVGLCLALLLLAPNIFIRLLILFPLLAFTYCFTLELHFLITNDKP